MTTTTPAAQLTRLAALRATAAAYPTEPYVVAVGTMVREMLLVGRAENHLYVLDSMGLPPAIGLGLCLGLDASQHEKVVVIEGDGGMLMGMSTLATIGLLQPRQLLLIVLDNGVYAATGDQPTAAAAVDFCAAARACGFASTWSVATEEALAGGVGGGAARVRDRRSCTCELHWRTLPVPTSLPDPVELTLSFQRYLNGK